MNNRTKKMMDEKIWLYLEILGVEAKEAAHWGHAARRLNLISEIAGRIFNEVEVVRGEQ